VAYLIGKDNARVGGIFNSALNIVRFTGGTSCRLG
jgi:hypothetical protein